MKFTTLINSELERLGKAPLEGIYYEQFRLVENNQAIQILEGDRTIAEVESIEKAKEHIHTINSGC